MIIQFLKLLTEYFRFAFSFFGSYGQVIIVLNNRDLQYWQIIVIMIFVIIEQP